MAKSLKVKTVEYLLNVIHTENEGLYNCVADMVIDLFETMTAIDKDGSDLEVSLEQLVQKIEKAYNVAIKDEGVEEEFLAKLEKKKAKLQEAYAAIDKIEKEKDELETQNENLKEDIQQMEIHADQDDDVIENLRGTVTTLNKKLAAKEKLLDDLEFNVDSLANQVKKLKAKF